MDIKRSLGIRGSRGVTLVELMVATAIISVGVLGLIGTFSFIQRGTQGAKEKTLANNLAQEKIESLKDISYYRLLVTTATASDDNFSPAMIYDVGPNGVETVNVGGINFQRRVYVRKVSENASGDLTYQSWSSADTSLKEVLIYVVWKSENVWRKLELRSLRDNPSRQELTASFSGTVTESGSGTPLSNATIVAMQNTSRYDVSDAAGAHSFSVEPGSYTLRASKTGYFVKYSGTLYAAAANSPVTANFALVKMASGSISGTAYLRDHLVISQVAASSGTQGGGEVEFVELYNPTTYTWTINSSTLELAYRNKNSGPAMAEILLTFNTGSLPPLQYFLIASTSPINFQGLSRTADAVYNEATLDKIIDAADGGIGIRAEGSGSWYDRVAWQKTGGTDAPSDFTETSPLEFVGGLADGGQLIRKSSATGITAGSGRAYDSNNNSLDIVHYPSPSHNANNSTVTEPLTAGTPASGALVFADDGLSSGATADSAGQFTLISVATGSWTVIASSGVLTQSVGLYGGTSDGFSTAIPTILYLTSSTSGGYVSGKVSDITGAGLSNILVEAGGGSDRTDASGNYLLLGSSGTSVLVVANPDDDNPLYVQGEANASFSTGEMATVNISLSQGGEITGTVTSNGIDPIPNIPITASQGGVERGSGISGSNGAFIIPNLSTGTYVVEPQLESGEASSPASASVSVTGGGSVAAGAFTVTGAMGYISGSLTLVSLTGPSITTGVLIYASTSTIASDPPSISSTTRSGSSIYYAASSQADGTYRVGVRGGYTYNVYAWYTTWSGDTPTTVRKSETSVSVSAGAAVDKDFFW
jgi:prepilin-type N-terminal cleavage/methylation domain-containing protein